MKRLFLIIVVLLQHSAALAQVAWRLPLTLNDANTEVGFAVDSTWHTIEGVTSEVQGKAWLDDPADVMSVRAEVVIPVASFRTGIGIRDRRLRSIMNAEQAPDIRVKINRLESGCAPQEAVKTSACGGVMRGTVTIRRVTHDVALPYEIRYEHEAFLVSGQVRLQWATFGVPDPSILIAEVNPIVTVNYAVRIPATVMPQFGTK